jgi:hypothetical protein
MQYPSLDIGWLLTGIINRTINENKQENASNINSDNDKMINELKRLKYLFEEEMITKQEYERRRKRIYEKYY